MGMVVCGSGVGGGAGDGAGVLVTLCEGRGWCRHCKYFDVDKESRCLCGLYDLLIKLKHVKFRLKVREFD